MKIYMKELTEKEAEDFLEKNNFNVIERQVVKNIKDIINVKIKFPWAMKISSSKIMHKAKLGGIALNINSIREAEKIFTKFSKMKNFEEVMIQKMSKGKEIIIGLKKTDEFGHVIMFGKGGSNAEKERDISFRVTPLKNKDFIEIINDTKISKTLSEDEKKEIIKILKKIQALSIKHPSIEELDINPLFVCDKSSETIDARIVFS